MLAASTIPVAQASPSDDAAGCTFVLPPAKVIQMSGTNYVYATIRPGPCPIRASPTLLTVCVSIQGEDSAGQCERGHPGQSEVYYPYRPGATYVVKGTGCANVFAPPYYPGYACQSLGPAYYTL
jgi:hypothetical protein